MIKKYFLMFYWIVTLTFSFGIFFNLLAEEKKRIKEHRKSHSALLTSCDQLRDELSTLANIEIKVRVSATSHHSSLVR